MADLGSKAALNADVDAKVTTNGANENTGARVNDCLNNIVDTLYGAVESVGFGDLTGTPQDNTSLAQQLETLANGIGAVTDLLPEKSYVAALSQVTTGNITATEIQNTYGETPVFARVDVGEYTITLAGAWTAGTSVDITNSVVSAGTDLRGFINYRVATTDVIELTCEDVDRVPQDIENTNFSIHIQS